MEQHLSNAHLFELHHVPNQISTYSSDNEGCSPQYSLHRSATQQDLSSEDEFEKEMAGEIASAIKLMVSKASVKRDIDDKGTSNSLGSLGSANQNTSEGM